MVHTCPHCRSCHSSSLQESLSKFDRITDEQLKVILDLIGIEEAPSYEQMSEWGWCGGDFWARKSTEAKRKQVLDLFNLHGDHVDSDTWSEIFELVGVSYEDGTVYDYLIDYGWDWDEVHEGLSKRPVVPLDQLGLSVRTYNCLKRHGITTTNRIERSSGWGELTKLQGLGRKGIHEIAVAMGWIKALPEHAGPGLLELPPILA